MNGWALRNLFDAHKLVTKPGLPTYLRLRNEPREDGGGVNDPDDYANYGFQIEVTGVAELDGVTDEEIKPRPDVEEMSLRQIGQVQDLLEGAHTFLISHNWVMRKQSHFGLSQPQQVFSHPDVFGFVYNGTLFHIHSWHMETIGGDIISWTVYGNRVVADISRED